MSGRRLIVMALAALSVAGCGGGGAKPTATLPSRTAVAANVNCRDLLRQAVALGKGVLAGSDSVIRRRINTMLIKPSIPLLESIAGRQRALEPAAHSTLYDRYVSMFDPIIVLDQERLAAGDAGNISLSAEVEQLMGSIGLTQEQTARELGLVDCELDFKRTLIDSLTS